MNFQQCEGRKAQALHKAPEPEEIVVCDASQDGQRGQQEGQQQKRGAGHGRASYCRAKGGGDWWAASQTEKNHQQTAESIRTRVMRPPASTKPAQLPVER
jgi:hypothetical protein